MFRQMTLGLAAVVVGFCVSSTANAIVLQTIEADEAYYTFGANVSANSGIRLLGDKAADIGFPDFQSISFLKFDQSDLPTTPFGPGGASAFLVLQQDNSLAPTLIPSSTRRPVVLSVYDVNAIFDPVDGNVDDIDYGLDGANSIATKSVGNNGFYRWDITDLVNQWILDPSSNNGLALSGLFGNTDIDGRNSYGIFHTVGSIAGLAPSIFVISEPPIVALLAFGLVAVFLRRPVGNRATQ